jgi:hypothetical protein
MGSWMVSTLQGFIGDSTWSIHWDDELARCDPDTAMVNTVFIEYAVCCCCLEEQMNGFEKDATTCKMLSMSSHITTLIAKLKNLVRKREAHRHGVSFVLFMTQFVL